MATKTATQTIEQRIIKELRKKVSANRKLNTPIIDICADIAAEYGDIQGEDAELYKTVLKLYLGVVYLQLMAPDYSMEAQNITEFVGEPGWKPGTKEQGA